MNETPSLRDLYAEFDAEFQKQSAAVQRAQERADKAKQARDGIRAAMEMRGEWVDALAEQAPARSRNRSTGGSSLSPTIRQVLPSINGKFTLHTIIDLVREINPDLVTDDKKASVSSALRRLSQEGDIKIVAQGAGKRATTFVVAGRDNSPEPLSDANNPVERGAA